MRDCYAGYVGVGGSDRAEGQEGFLGEGTAAVAEEGDKGRLAGSGGNAELGR